MLVSGRCAAAPTPPPLTHRPPSTHPNTARPTHLARPSPALPQLGGAVTPLYASVFMENMLPGSGMDPTKQPDGSIALFMPVGQSTVGGRLGGQVWV